MPDLNYTRTIWTSRTHRRRSSVETYSCGIYFLSRGCFKENTFFQPSDVIRFTRRRSFTAKQRQRTRNDIVEQAPPGGTDRHFYFNVPLYVRLPVVHKAFSPRSYRLSTPTVSVSLARISSEKSKVNEQLASSSGSRCVTNAFVDAKNRRISDGFVNERRIEKLFSAGFPES